MRRLALVVLLTQPVLAQETPVTEPSRVPVPARVAVDDPFLQRLLEGTPPVPAPLSTPQATEVAPPRTVRIVPVPFTNPTPYFIFEPLQRPQSAVPQLSPEERRAAVERFRQAAAGKKRARRDPE